MAFLEKLKQSATSAREKVSGFAEEKKLGEKFAGMKTSVKRTFGGDKNKEEMMPLEGALIRYDVAYLGGLPEYADSKGDGLLGMNLMEDRFVFTDTFQSRAWFCGYCIPYNSVTGITLEERNMSNAEAVLSFAADLHTQQANNICISFRNTHGVELMLRLAMRTGGTIYKQAAKCREFMDILRQYGIMTAIKEQQQTAPQQPDILDQIERMAQLRDAGILTEEEFTQKKTQLLEKL